MKKYFLIALFCSISVCSFGQIKEAQAIDSIFAEWDRPDVPGGAIGVIQDGKLIYAKGYGIGNLEHDIEITPSTVFDIASLSKQFVAFSILLLEEQGKLGLDDQIQKYLPDFPEYDAPITIRHLIHHTSGVRDYLDLLFLRNRSYLDNIETYEVYDLLKRQKELNFTPGEEYLYSNSGYFMLAMIVEKASDQTLRSFAREHIFDPLGMKSTCFYDDNTDIIKNRAFSYGKKRAGDGFNNMFMRSVLVGDGGAFSTIEDLYLWDQNFYNNKLGKGGQEIIHKMHEEGLLNNGEGTGYIFGLHIGTYKGLKTVGRSGVIAGYRPGVLRFPEENFSIIGLANRSDAYLPNKGLQVADIFLKDKFKHESEKVTSNGATEKDIEASEVFTLEQIAGNYEIRPGVVLNFTIQDDSLNVLQTWNKMSYNIVRTQGNTYQIPAETDLSFTFSDLKEGHTQTLSVLQWDTERKAERRKEIDFSGIALNDYIGSYFCNELNVTYNFAIEDGILKANIENSRSKMDCTILDKDEFNMVLGLVRFQRKDGVISGFELNSGRANNLKFEKR